MRSGLIGLALGSSCLSVLWACQTGQSSASAVWPASLSSVLRAPYPSPLSPCRIVGETAATVNYLDDSATLVGCLSRKDAALLGGQQVAVLDGVFLVSVPRRPK